ncbi:unnamed protein product, partial [Ectocarpus sp. 13 AM-2016]
ARREERTKADAKRLAFVVHLTELEAKSIVFEKEALVLSGTGPAFLVRSVPPCTFTTSEALEGDEGETGRSTGGSAVASTNPLASGRSHGRLRGSTRLGVSNTSSSLSWMSLLRHPVRVPRLAAPSPRRGGCSRRRREYALWTT